MVEGGYTSKNVLAAILNVSVFKKLARRAITNEDHFS